MKGRLKAHFGKRYFEIQPQARGVGGFCSLRAVGKINAGQPGGSNVEIWVFPGPTLTVMLPVLVVLGVISGLIALATWDGFMAIFLIVLVLASVVLVGFSLLLNSWDYEDRVLRDWVDAVVMHVSSGSPSEDAP
jgi:hypothetical protein